MRVKTLKKGERVVVDPNLTIQSIYNIFYWCINVGSLSGIATTLLEHRVDFWAAFLLPFCFFWLAVAALLIGRNKYVMTKPTGSVIPRALKALWIGMRRGFNMDAAKPSYQMQTQGSTSVPWDDTFIDELKRVLIACRVFIAFPIFWVAYGQMSNNLVSQAGQMQSHGIPNDLMQNLDPIAIIILIPLFEKFFYPALRAARIPFRPITRISVGFAIVAIGMGYAAIVQEMIYKAGPCYNHPLKCKAAEIKGSHEKLPNHVHVLVQAPIYILTAIGEIFASVVSSKLRISKISKIY
jgi:POT family proton-dependent oligopeptide transporter